MIHLNKVSKRYGNKIAVEDLTLEIQAGELFAFLGPNGAGKTTTIKMMCGLLFPSSGTVAVGGHDMRFQGDLARQLIAYVPDQPYLYEKLTGGREFLQFVGEMYGLPRDVTRQRINQVIEMFHLDEFVDGLTESYSHGMRQRTVFASALVHQPSVLIVDEPTVGLDPRVRQLKDLLREQANQGATVFLSSHSLDVVEELADRIAIVDHGRLIGCGSLESLRSQAALDGSLEEVFLKLTEEADQDGQAQETGIVTPTSITERPGFKR